MRDPEPTNEAVGATNEVNTPRENESNVEVLAPMNDDDIDLQDFEPEMAPDMPLIFFD